MTVNGLVVAILVGEVLRSNIGQFVCRRRMRVGNRCVRVIGSGAENVGLARRAEIRVCGGHHRAVVRDCVGVPGPLVRGQLRHRAGGQIDPVDVLLVGILSRRGNEQPRVILGDVDGIDLELPLGELRQLFVAGIEQVEMAIAGQFSNEHHPSAVGQVVRLHHARRVGPAGMQKLVDDFRILDREVRLVVVFVVVCLSVVFVITWRRVIVVGGLRVVLAGVCLALLRVLLDKPCFKNLDARGLLVERGKADAAGVR